MQPLEQLFNQYIYWIWILKRVFDDHGIPLELLGTMNKLIYSVCSWSIGAGHGCVIVINGAAYICGDIYTGVNWDNKDHTKSDITKLGIRNVKEFIYGTNCSFAITTDGVCYAHGSNRQNKLGIGMGVSSEYYYGFGKLPLRGLKKVIGNQYHTLFLTSSETLHSCGEGFCGELGLDTVNLCTRPKLINISDVVDIYSCNNCNFAITKTNKLLAWGKNEFGLLGDKSHTCTPTEISLPFTLSRLICGYKRLFIMTDDQEIYVYGSLNRYGELGIGEMEPDSTGVIRLFMSNFDARVVKIACGSNHTLFLTKLGSIYVCGSNNCGQLGMVDMQQCHVPTRLSYNWYFIDIACGTHHSMAVTKEGKIFTWGANNRWQLGLPHKSDQYTPQEITF